MATSSSREERRKRILERGSDRLALISGRISSLPSSPVASPHHRRAATTHLSTHSLFFTRDHHEQFQALLSDQNNAGTESPVAPSVPHQLLKHNSLVVTREKTFDFGKKFEPQVPNYETISEVNQIPVVDESTKSQTKPEPATVPLIEKTSNDTELQPKPTRNEHKPKPTRTELSLFSCKQISSCITASQGTRSVYALMIALSVVLSYIDDAFLGINLVSSGSVEALRPLYILLITDVTIVLAQVFLKQQKQFEEAEKEKVEPQEDGHNMTQAIQLMEKSLVVYQTARAVFIDFSIYTVVVVCGLSLA